MGNRAAGQSLRYWRVGRCGRVLHHVLLACGAFLIVVPGLHAQERAAIDSAVCAWLMPHMKAVLSGQSNPTDSVQAVLRRLVALKDNTVATPMDLESVLSDTVHAPGIGAAIKAGQVDSAKTLMRRLVNNMYPKAEEIDKNLEIVFVMIDLMGSMPDTLRAFHADQVAKGKPAALSCSE